MTQEFSPGDDADDPDGIVGDLVRFRPPAAGCSIGRVESVDGELIEILTPDGETVFRSLDNLL